MKNVTQRGGEVDCTSTVGYSNTFNVERGWKDKGFSPVSDMVEVHTLARSIRLKRKRRGRREEYKHFTFGDNVGPFREYTILDKGES